MTPLEQFEVVWDGRKDAVSRGYLTTQPDEPRSPARMLEDNRHLCPPGKPRVTVCERVRAFLSVRSATASEIEQHIGAQQSVVATALAVLRREGSLQTKRSGVMNSQRRHLLLYWIEPKP